MVYFNTVKISFPSLTYDFKAVIQNTNRILLFLCGYAFDYVCEKV